MNRNKGNGNHYFEAKLPCGVYQFKFFVDGKLLCSDNYKRINNEGTVNNVIELKSTKENPQPFITEKQQQLLKMMIEEDKQKKLRRKEEDKLRLMAKVYGIYYPKQSQMNYYTPDIPFHYQDIFDINKLTNQTNVGTHIYYDYHEQDLLSENNSYKNILRCPHVNLNHICMCNSVEKSTETCVKAAVSENRKHKVITVVYYVPKLKGEKSRSFALELIEEKKNEEDKGDDDSH